MKDLEKNVERSLGWRFQIIVKKLESLDLRYLMVTAAHRQELLEAKKMLESEV